MMLILRRISSLVVEDCKGTGEVKISSSRYFKWLHEGKTNKLISLITLEFSSSSMANQLFSPSLFLPSFLLPFPSLFSLLIFSLSLPLPLKFIEVLENLCYSTEHTLGNGGRDGSGMAVWIPGCRQRRILWSESPCKPWAVHMTPLGHTAVQLCHTTQLWLEMNSLMFQLEVRGGKLWTRIL